MNEAGLVSALFELMSSRKEMGNETNTNVVRRAPCSGSEKSGVLCGNVISTED